MGFTRLIKFSGLRRISKSSFLDLGTLESISFQVVEDADESLAGDGPFGIWRFWEEGLLVKVKGFRSETARYAQIIRENP